METLVEDSENIKVIFGNSFCFYFQNFVFENKKKTIFLYFLNQKHVWLVEIKKKSLLKKKKLKYVVIRV